MFPPFPPDYPYGHPLNPYDTGNAVNPLSVFAVQNPILQAIRSGAATLGQKPATPSKPPAGAGSPGAGPAPIPGGPPAPTPLPGGPTAPPTTLGGWPGITPQPVPSPIGTTLDPTTGQPIESVTSTFTPTYDPTQAGGYWSSDPVTGSPVWVDSGAGATIDLGYGGGGGSSGDISLMSAPDLGY